jgi:phage FluMu gp28-like protein
MSSRKSILSLYAYQQELFFDNSKNIIVCLPRQAGKSYTIAAKIVDHAFKEISKNRRVTWFIVSRSYEQSLIVLDYCKKFCKAYSMLFEFFEGKEPETETIIKEIRLPLDSKITALPMNADTIRGRGGNFFGDEFDLHDGGKGVWGALLPIASNPQHKIILASTPSPDGGTSGQFYEFLTSEKLAHRWSRHYLNIYQCVEQGLDRDINELRELVNDPIIWEREFECKFVTGSTFWFPHSLVAPCQTDDAGIPEAWNQQGDIFIGVDIAWNRNLWVAWVLERIGEMRFTREVSIITFDGDKTNIFQRQDEELDRLVNYYNPRKIMLDATGIGKKPVEDATRRYGTYRVEGLDFNVVNKYKLATGLRQALENRSITIPRSQEVLKDFGKVQRVVTKSGQVTFTSKNDSEGHSDRTWACALAWLASTDVPIIRPDFSGIAV